WSLDVRCFFQRSCSEFLAYRIDGTITALSCSPIPDCDAISGRELQKNVHPIGSIYQAPAIVVRSNPLWLSLESMSMRRLLGFLLKAAISGFLLSFAFRRVNFIPLGQRLDKIEYHWLVVAILIFITQTTLGALRWQTIVNHCNPFGFPSFTTAFGLS